LQLSMPGYKNSTAISPLSFRQVRLWRQSTKVRPTGGGSHTGAQKPNRGTKVRQDKSQTKVRQGQMSDKIHTYEFPPNHCQPQSLTTTASIPTLLTTASLPSPLTTASLPQSTHDCHPAPVPLTIFSLPQSPHDFQPTPVPSRL
jgi:hypothetical protein